MCISVCLCLHVWVPQRPGEDIEFPRAGVAGSCEPISMCAGNQISPLQEQPASTLQLSSNPSPGPWSCFYCSFVFSWFCFLIRLITLGQILDMLAWRYFCKISLASCTDQRNPLELMRAGASRGCVSGQLICILLVQISLLGTSVAYKIWWNVKCPQILLDPGLLYLPSSWLCSYSS